MAFFRGGDNEDVKKELLDIVDAKKGKCHKSQQSFFGIATSGEFWKPFSCVGVICILFRLSCFSILSHYTAPFLDRAEINLDPLLAAVLIGVFRLVFSLSAFLILSITSKRTAFILGGTASTLGMLLGKSQIPNQSKIFKTVLPLSVSIHSHLLDALSPTPEWLMNKGWVPLLGFFTVTACHPVLLGIILVLLGELFPTDMRTVSIGTVNGLQYLVFAFATKVFPYLEEWFHFYGLNYYYAAFALALTLWGMVTIKDIDELSLVEIERIYGTRRKQSEGSSNGSESKDPNYGSFKKTDDTF